MVDQDVRGNANTPLPGGVWQAVVFGFAGVRLTPSGPIVETPPAARLDA